MDEFPQDCEVLDLGDVTLQHSATLRDASSGRRRSRGALRFCCAALTRRR
jgi:hypothetical protein